MRLTPKDLELPTSPQRMASRLVGVTALFASLGALGCSSNSASSNSTCTSPGGAVAGPADSHCGDTVVTVDPNICSTASDNTSDDAGTGLGDYGDTMDNNEGDEDDCKYHVVWSSTPICENNNVSFSIKVTAKDGGGAVTGAMPYIEAFLTDTHPAHMLGQATQESAGGNYTMGPVRFDAAGQWTVRFHLFSSICDEPQAPHGHAAFYVNVP